MRLDKYAWEERPPVIIIFALLLVLAMLGVSRSANADPLTVYFDNTTYGGDVWLQVQDPFYNSSGNFQASYDNGKESIDFSDGNSQTLMSKPVKLSDIGAGGLTIDHSDSAVFFIYYDDPSQESRTAAPAYPTSKLRFMPFELTMMGGSGDQGNLTAINYFTAPLGIKSYQNDPTQNPSETVIQQTGFGDTSATTIGNQLDTATNGNSSAVVQNDDNKIIRYLGPSSFTGDNPWPSFISYAQSVNQANQSTTIKRTNGFNFAAPDNTPVYQFGGDMAATAAADGTITLTGSVTVSANTSPTGTNPTVPTSGEWTDATITISASSATDYNNAIYGQAANSAVTFTGTAWSDFETFTKNTLRDSSKPHDTSTNKSLYDLGAYDTTKAMLIGEITTGLLGGFVNSDYKVGGVAIKDMESNSWWSLSGNPAFATIQPDNAYYNPYANVIFETSGNTVYGVPYSDRFGSGPLVNTVNYNGTPINYWTVDIGAPLGSN